MDMTVGAVDAVRSDAGDRGAQCNPPQSVGRAGVHGAPGAEGRCLSGPRHPHGEEMACWQPGRHLMS